MKRVVTRTFTLGIIGGAAFLLARAISPAQWLMSDLRKRTHTAGFIEHSHEAVVHRHEHPHVTHNHREGPDGFMGEWEHLTAMHEHNHAAITHSHLPHVDAAHEHLGEAHIHDQSHPSTS
jgi:hypothetical protein